MEFLMVITTCENKEDAKSIATNLLKKELAACIQIQSVESLYTWKGDIANDPEQLLFIKTKQSLYKEVENEILLTHKYETPEIIALPIINGSNGYLNWIGEVTKK